MLIVLSFMVGGFVTKATQSAPIPKEPSALTNVSAVAAMPRRDLFRLDLFESGTSQLQDGKAEALVAVFSSHDLAAEVTVFGDADLPPLAGLGQASARAMALLRALESPQIPTEAIVVRAALSERGTQAQIELIDTSSGAQ
jgi:galactokinase/mevalonate kinase-like predicted kinase